MHMRTVAAGVSQLLTEQNKKLVSMTGSGDKKYISAFCCCPLEPSIYVSLRSMLLVCIAVLLFKQMAVYDTAF